MFHMTHNSFFKFHIYYLLIASTPMLHNFNINFIFAVSFKFNAQVSTKNTHSEKTRWCLWKFSRLRK